VLTKLYKVAISKVMNLQRRGLLGGGLFAGLAAILFGTKHVESSTSIVDKTAEPERPLNTSPIADPWSDAEEMECKATISYKWKNRNDASSRMWNWHFYTVPIKWTPGKTREELIDEACRVFWEMKSHQTDIVYCEITVTGFLFPV